MKKPDFITEIHEGSHDYLIGWITDKDHMILQINKENPLMYFWVIDHDGEGLEEISWDKVPEAIQGVVCISFRNYRANKESK